MPQVQDLRRSSRGDENLVSISTSTSKTSGSRRWAVMTSKWTSTRLRMSWLCSYPTITSQQQTLTTWERRSHLEAEAQEWAGIRHRRWVSTRVQEWEQAHRGRTTSSNNNEQTSEKRKYFWLRNITAKSKPYPPAVSEPKKGRVSLEAGLRTEDAGVSNGSLAVAQPGALIKFQ